MTAHRAGRVAIFGDLSGHTTPLYRALEALGVDLWSMVLPDDLTVIQLGDLVHRGPDGDEAVAFVDAMLTANPQGWIQLLGNHEAQHVDGPGFGRCDCAIETAQTIRRWVRTGATCLAVALEDRDLGPLLCSHAGLGRPYWQLLGCPSTAEAAARALAEVLRTDRAAAFAAGSMLGRATERPGVLWAEAGAELYGTWHGHRPPFSQVHGHTTAFDWARRRAAPSLPDALVACLVADEAQRHVTVRIGQRRFIGIDPCYGHSRPAIPLVPLQLDAATLLHQER